MCSHVFGDDGRWTPGGQLKHQTLKDRAGIIRSTWGGSVISSQNNEASMSFRYPIFRSKNLRWRIETYSLWRRSWAQTKCCSRITWILIDIACQFSGPTWPRMFSTFLSCDPFQQSPKIDGKVPANPVVESPKSRSGGVSPPEVGGEFPEFSHCISIWGFPEIGVPPNQIHFSGSFH